MPRSVPSTAHPWQGMPRCAMPRGALPSARTPRAARAPGAVYAWGCLGALAPACAQVPHVLQSFALHAGSMIRFRRICYNFLRYDIQL